MKHFFCLVCSWGLSIVHAQHLPNPALSAVMASGGYSRWHSDVFGVLVNPAAIANARQFSAGVYGERKYLLQRMQQFSGLLQIPMSASGIGLQFDYAGSSLMNETALGLIYGRRLGAKLDAGLRFRYYQLQVPGYLQASALWAEAGFLFQLSEQLRSGFSFSRATQTSLASTEPPLTEMYRMGLNYEPSRKVCITVDWIKETHKTLQGTFILMYFFEEGLHLKLGWNTSAAQPIAGAGIKWKHTRTDIIISYHPYLGLTPALQVLWNKKQKNKSE